ncbi:MAG: sugar phosphate isomerase/epimerase [Paenibacillaceae bacterium]|jgi:sugar phosphate isomerase/epimerase|nr:sugar phosphate isomerase/epimerase [Paenibacillaceae bacterium]
MFTLSAFADEISDDPVHQLAVLKDNNIRWLELRSMWGVNVLQLSPEQLDHVKIHLAGHGVRVSSIGSPIGKIQLTEPFLPHLEALEKVIAAARCLGAPYIRIFSFYIPKGEAPALYRDLVMERMKAICAIAEKEKIMLVHENEKHIYGDTPERCLDIMNTCASPYLRCAFDPANFIQCGVRPMTDAYPLLKDYVEYVHVKDALLETGKVVPAGTGDGQAAELLKALQDRGFEGFLSMEPHLRWTPEYKEQDPGEVFSVAVRALRRLLDELRATVK